MKHFTSRIWIVMITMPAVAAIMILFMIAAAGCSAPVEAAVAATPVASSALTAEGHILPGRDTTLAFLIPGTVSEVLVKMGDAVKEGDPLLRLDHSAQAEAEVVAAQQAYDLLLRNASGDHAAAWQAYMDAQKVREAATEKWNDINLRDIENRIEDRQEDLVDRQKDLEETQAKFEKYKERGREDANYRWAEDDLEAAQGDYDDAVKDLEAAMRERDLPRATLDAALAAEAEAKHQYELGLDGPNTDRLALLKARLAAAEDVFSNYVLTAPFDGVVMDVNVSAGDQVAPEIYAIKLADTGDWYVETSDLTELDVVEVEVGQRVNVTPDALPDLHLPGVVESIDLVSTERSGDILYTVRIHLDEVEPLLRWGMTVEVAFESQD